MGHAQNIEAGTGFTVVICRQGAVAGMDVRGAPWYKGNGFNETR